MESLFDRLVQNGNSDMYPLHMPGHKRRAWGELPDDLYRNDITEIDGFDNLHQPEGILRELQKEASHCYGADRSYYLVNGSTAGILSAVSAALPYGGHILMARNCHKSAYHAAYLRGLTISYLYPTLKKEYDILEAVAPGQVREALEKEKNIGAVLIVSPTYEGRIANVREIAEIVHRKGIPLIVDEAHGAHLGLAEGFHENSCQAGADLVIHSVHKTLPSLTQTALIHVCGKLVNVDMLERFLHIYQSSSPSYLLMASIDNALKYVNKNGRRAFADFQGRYAEMLRKLSACQNLKFPASDAGCQDPGKLVISVKNTDMSGKELYDVLVQEYHLQPEMASETYVLAMFTVNDSQEGYDRLVRALCDIDSRLGVVKDDFPESAAYGGGENESEKALAVVPLAAAWDMETEEIPLEKSVGRCSGEFVNLYPPGIPLLVPGELVTENLVCRIRMFIRQNLTVQGIKIQKEKILIRMLR